MRNASSSRNDFEGTQVGRPNRRPSSRRLERPPLGEPVSR